MPRVDQQGNATRILAIVVGVVVAAFIALLAFGGSSDEDSTSRLLGKRVPAVAGTGILGQDFDIDDSRGRWVLVNFFSTWCGPCIAEHPDLVELQDWGLNNNNLDVVAIVFDDSTENISEFFEDNGGGWPVLASSELIVDFQIRAVPETFLIRPDGVVARHYTGGITADSIVATIEAAG